MLDVECVFWFLFQSKYLSFLLRMPNVIDVGLKAQLLRTCVFFVATCHLFFFSLLADLSAIFGFDEDEEEEDFDGQEDEENEDDEDCDGEIYLEVFCRISCDLKVHFCV